MTQLSLLSADLVAPRACDLGGLLAADGRLMRSGSGWELTVTVDATWRAQALQRELQVRDVPVTLLAAGGSVEVRGAPADALDEVADQWCGPRGKTVPEEFTPLSGTLRCWVLAAGRPDPPGFRLGLDPRAPQLHDGLAAACAAVGLASSLIAGGAGRPALRIVGRRRIARLADMIGTRPPGSPPDAFPHPPH